MKIRTFVALGLSDRTHSLLKLISQELQTKIPHFRWSKTNQSHITLRFLDLVEDELISSLAKAISNELKRVQPFQLTLSGIGGFPSLHKCRVLWVGAKDGQEECRHVKSLIDRALQQFSFPSESELFVPHVTLGRSQSGKIVNLGPAIVKSIPQDFEFVELIETVSILKSELGPSGPVYTQLAETRLTR